ncbi:MAG: IPT/TIG domain-containing protein, partial [Armatimonadetes bacterium]|nr:IPT/TIG domain-containing protein [Armatimonadota bacterium]
MGDESLRPPRGFLDFLLPPRWRRVRTSPRIEALVPTSCQPGQRVTIRGRDLWGAAIRVGTTSVRPTSGTHEEVIIEAPSVVGRHWVYAQNVFGTAQSPTQLEIVEPAWPGPQGFTFRGDAHGSIVPSRTNQRYMVLLVLG